MEHLGLWENMEHLRNWIIYSLENLLNNVGKHAGNTPILINIGWVEGEKKIEDHGS